MNSLIVPNIVKLAVPRGTNPVARVFIEIDYRRRTQDTPTPSVIGSLLHEIPSCTQP